MIGKSILIGLVASASAAVDKQPIFEWYKGIDVQNVLYAVTCGSSEALTDMSGIQYTPDVGYSGGFQSNDGQAQRWVIPNSEVYQTERWADENFNYKIPFSLAQDGVFTLILKFSEQYFNEPNMKIFDVRLGDTTVIPSLDIVALAGSKLLPYDTFHELEVKNKKIYYEGKEIKGAHSKDQLKIDFIKGSYDNPKVNAILLVKGGADNTHKKNYDNFQKMLQDLQMEREMQKAQEEAFFPEDAYDYDEHIDGRGSLNQFLSISYGLEGCTIAFLVVFFRILPKSH